MASRGRAFWIALGVFVAIAWVTFYLSEVSILYFQAPWPAPDSKVVMCRYFHAPAPTEDYCPSNDSARGCGGSHRRGPLSWTSYRLSEARTPRGASAPFEP